MHPLRPECRGTLARPTSTGSESVGAHPIQPHLRARDPKSFDPPPSRAALLHSAHTVGLILIGFLVGLPIIRLPLHVGSLMIFDVPDNRNIVSAHYSTIRKHNSTLSMPFTEVTIRTTTVVFVGRDSIKTTAGWMEASVDDLEFK